MKNKRQEKLLELIRNNEIITQEQLVAMLEEAGHTATQATVSRDIKELQIVKIPAKDSVNSGKYKFAVNQEHEIVTGSAGQTVKFISTLRDSIIKIDLADHLCIIKTTAGMAQGVAAVIDSMTEEIAARAAQIYEEEIKALSVPFETSNTQPNQSSDGRDFILGTLAGDDTIFIALKGSKEAARCGRAIADIIK